MFAGFSQFTFGASTQLVMFMFLTSMTAAGAASSSRSSSASRGGWSRRRPRRGRSSPARRSGGIARRAAPGGLHRRRDRGRVPRVVGRPAGRGGADLAVRARRRRRRRCWSGALSRNPDQASSLGVFAGLALGALGGCMIPYQTMPDAMQSGRPASSPTRGRCWACSRSSATAAAIETVAPNVAVLAAFGVVLMGARRVALPQGDRRVGPRRVAARYGAPGPLGRPARREPGARRPRPGPHPPTRHGVTRASRVQSWEQNRTNRRMSAARDPRP